MRAQTNTISSLLKPTPCAFTWEGTPLTDSELPLTSSHDLSLEISLEEALALLSKSETFTTHLEISKATKGLFKNKPFSSKIFMQQLGYANLELISKIETLVDFLPKNFYIWSISKKLSPKDFRAFLNDYNAEKDQRTFQKIADLNPTKNNGLQIIEYYFDLKALKKIEDDYILKFKHADKLLNALKKLRFSGALNADQDISDRLAKLNLSKNIKIGLRRLGDQRQIKLEVISSSPEELMTNLNKTRQKIDDISKAWK